MELTRDKKLGAGAFGIVYSAIDKEGNIYAVKEQHTTRLTEIIAGKLQHPNLLRHVEISPGGVGVKIVSTPVGTPLSKMVRDVNFTLEQRYSVIGDIVNGLNHLHINGILHRDLSLNNVIITPEKKAILIDYGASMFGRGKCGDYPNYQQDLYILAIVIFEILTRQLSGDNIDDIIVDEKQLQHLYTLAKVDDPVKWAMLTQQLATEQLTTTQLCHLLNLNINGYVLPFLVRGWIKDLKKCYHEVMNYLTNYDIIPYYLIVYIASIYAGTDMTLQESCNVVLDMYNFKESPEPGVKKLVESKIDRPLMIETLDDALRIHSHIEQYSDIKPFDLENSFHNIVTFGEVRKHFDKA